VCPSTRADAGLRGYKAVAPADLRVDGSWVSPLSGMSCDAPEMRRWSGAG